jgi:hypothetical protein
MQPCLALPRARRITDVFIRPSKILPHKISAISQQTANLAQKQIRNTI